MELRAFLESEKLKVFPVGQPLTIPSGTTVGEAIAKMQAARKGCLLIRKGIDIIGIFTERDALTKVAELKADLNTPIDTVMTVDPKVLSPEDSVADAIRLMHRGGYRHIPLITADRELIGVVSIRDIVRALAEHFPYSAFNLPPNVHQVNRAREGA